MMLSDQINMKVFLVFQRLTLTKQNKVMHLRIIILPLTCNLHSSNQIRESNNPIK